MGKVIQTRIKNKIATERDWQEAGNAGFIPLNGEIIIYNFEDNTPPQIKIGDGVTNINLLPFITQLGCDNKIGIMGYYFNNIDFTNKVIRITDVQPGVRDTTKGNATSEVGLSPNTEFNTDWQVYDVISIVNSSKYDANLVITAIDHDLITVATLTDAYTFLGYDHATRAGKKGSACYDVNADLPFTTVKNVVPDYDDYGVSNIDRLSSGIVDLAPYAYAEGVENIVTGAAAHAEGKQNKALGHYAHAEGRKTFATYNAHAEGYKTEARGQGTHTEGHETKGKGKAVHAEGYQTKALADYAHSEGVKSEATAESSHAEGNATQATARGTHSEGILTKATSEAAHSEGRETDANGPYSHAGGYCSSANGAYSFAHGDHVYARDGQCVFGIYNKDNWAAIAQWGHGTKAEPSNAFEILYDGSFNYKDPIEGYTNSTTVREKTVKTITDNYTNYQRFLKSVVDKDCVLTHRTELSSEQVYKYTSNDRLLHRDTDDVYYGNLDNRGILYNISPNLILKENRGFNTAVDSDGISFSFRDDGGIHITGTLNHDGDIKDYAQYHLLHSAGNSTDLIKRIIQVIRAQNEANNIDNKLYLKLDSPNNTSTPVKLQISYTEGTSDLQYFSVSSNETDYLELKADTTISNIYLQINLNGLPEGTSFDILVYPYVSFENETSELGQILTVPKEYNKYWPLIPNGYLYSETIEAISLYANKTDDILAQISNENNTIFQKDNEALGEYSVALGKENKTFSENSVCEGLMNLAGVQLETALDLPLTNAFLDDNYHTCLVSTAYHNLPIDSAIVVYTDGYYFSCRLQDILSNEDNTYTYILLNHLPAGTVAKNLDTTFVYAITPENNISDSCHTEHVEGAYNISAATGDGVFSSRVSHIEGHTNISFGQYNHIEGVRNKALNQTEMTHVEGRFNTVDGGTGTNNKVICSHVRGENNILTNSNHATLSGSNNTVYSSPKAHVSGSYNTLTDSSYSAVGGYKNEGTGLSNAIIHGENLKAASKNKAVFGTFNVEDPDALFIVGNGDESNPKNAFTINSDGTASVFAEPTKDNDVANKSFVEKASLSTVSYETEMAISDREMALSNSTQYIVLKVLEGSSVWDTDQYLADAPSRIVAYNSDNNVIDSVDIPDQLLNTADFGAAYTIFDFTTGEFVNSGRTVIFTGADEENWQYHSTQNFAYVALSDGLAAADNTLLNDPYYDNKYSQPGKEAKFYSEGKVFRVYIGDTTFDEFKTELSSRPMVIRYKFRRTSSFNITNFSTFKNTLNTAGSTHLGIEKRFDSSSITCTEFSNKLTELETNMVSITNQIEHKIADNLGNSYSILIVDELPTVQDPRTIYLVKE